MVKITPPAIDSPAEPAVWTMLFSRIDAGEPRALDRCRKTVMEMTAIGMEAEVYVFDRSIDRVDTIVRVEPPKL